jgi:CRP-like cAMP-binding protein
VADIAPEVLQQVTVFSTCTPEQLTHLAAVSDLTEHSVGDELTGEGSIGRFFHLILEGGAVVDRGGQTIATVSSGDFVGEIALLGGGRSTATVRCTAPTRCLTLERQRFWEVLEREPAIALRILEVVCRRLEQAASPAANIAGAWGSVFDED